MQMAKFIQIFDEKLRNLTHDLKFHFAKVDNFIGFRHEISTDQGLHALGMHKNYSRIQYLCYLKFDSYDCSLQN